MSARSKGRRGGGLSYRERRGIPLDGSTRTRLPQITLKHDKIKSVRGSRSELTCAHVCDTDFPSSPRTASSASLESSNSTKAKPGGFLAIQTVLRGP
ncbi:hypothetical protein XENOCAPTIV_020178 [Xenoophorus captivus]|uniref:Uncharacterized protein n=1 Tax=Xenoophorus captivus TaxID=1517983 RepID=A0ABV0RTJ7_9TELE